MTPFRGFLFALTLAVLAGCSSTPYKDGYPFSANWAVLPVQSLQSEEAGIQIERMLTVLLASKGIKKVELPPETETRGDNSLLDSAHRLKNALQWAAQHGVELGMAGTVNEYTKSTDGRFAMDLTLNLMDIKTGDVMWTTSGRGEGRPGDDPIAVGRKLVSTLLSGLPLTSTMKESSGWFSWVSAM
ncbi:hypothetical protein [Sansalvadorimonas verongulae]|uniref:hypothetical protein n=1 Tax=Sansalvadorimonas verongulae TaxID=2172824 RepID=UPI0012BC1A31|nr:hypothetical protein [Sansalvadorimonas verongulae]MTI15311.1 hypothetical protein [Sansalvadorimonas verongulae]